MEPVKKNLVYYGKEVEEAILALSNEIKGKAAHSHRWLAIQYFEGNEYVKMYLHQISSSQKLTELLSNLETTVQKRDKAKTLATYIYLKRKETIEKITSEIARKSDGVVPLTEKIDLFVTNKYLGMPIFLLFMYLMFELTFDWLGTPISDALDALLTGPVTSWFETVLNAVHASAFIHALIINGLVAGVGGSVFIWLLSYAGPEGLNVNMNHSFLAAIGGVLAPILAPLGFGTWQAAASLITGFLAKESIISTMNIIYFAKNDAGLQGLLSHYYTPLAAYSFMVFILLYIPCLATTATIYKETASKKWTLFAVGYALVIAFVLSFVLYQGGKLFGLV